MQNSFELFESLYKLQLIDLDKTPLWWPDAGGFQTLLEVILTQQTRWEKVNESIRFLKTLDMFSLEKIIAAEQWRVASAIVPSGFYNQKASRIIKLCKNIKEEFDNFESFKESVTRGWLLAQSGIGQESADAILCYICKKETMVVDSYTARLLGEFGFAFESYEEIQEWLEFGIFENQDLIFQKYKELKDLNMVFCIFHGLIVEYCKQNCKKSEVDLKGLK
ncbi:MAG: endonuclease related protein [Campylobacterota bacterium]|nr:endonuclease related protein [Campylobacterota bacterium]